MQCEYDTHHDAKKQQSTKLYYAVGVRFEFKISWPIYTVLSRVNTLLFCRRSRISRPILGKNCASTRYHVFRIPTVDFSFKKIINPRKSSMFVIIWSTVTLSWPSYFVDRTSGILIRIFNTNFESLRSSYGHSTRNNFSNSLSLPRAQFFSKLTGWRILHRRCT